MREIREASMKHRRIFLRTIAIIAAFSVALTSEKAAFGAVLAAPSFDTKDIDKNTSENLRGGVKPTLKTAYTADI